MSKVLTVRGQRFQVFQSERAGKKFKVYVDGKPVHFGAKGYSIAPGTSKGDNYCARSSGIPTKPFSPNEFSRAMWKCKRKKSTK